MSAKSKICYLVRDYTGYSVMKKFPVPEWRPDRIYPEFRYRFHGVVISTTGSPQQEKMWKKALKGKRGKYGICDIDFETWIPMVVERCFVCVGHEPGCIRCHDTGTFTRLMTVEDLKHECYNIEENRLFYD